MSLAVENLSSRKAILSARERESNSFIIPSVMWCVLESKIYVTSKDELLASLKLTTVGNIQGTGCTGPLK